jgi:hypothetical protein
MLLPLPVRPDGSFLQDKVTRQFVVHECVQGPLGNLPKQEKVAGTCHLRCEKCLKGT